MASPRAARRSPAASGRRIMTKRAALAVWGFVVGDDWVTAVGVALAIAATALLASAKLTAWWLLPVAVVILLAHSVGRERRRRWTEPALRPSPRCPARRRGF